jgi:hypothetical protein
LVDTSARAGSDHAVAAPLITAMKSRRLMCSSQFKCSSLPHHSGSQVNFDAIVRDFNDQQMAQPVAQQQQQIQPKKEG